MSAFVSVMENGSNHSTSVLVFTVCLLMVRVIVSKSSPLDLSSCTRRHPVFGTYSSRPGASVTAIIYRNLGILDVLDVCF